MDRRLIRLVKAAKELLQFGAHEGECTNSETCDKCGSSLEGCETHIQTVNARVTELQEALKNSEELGRPPVEKVLFYDEGLRQGLQKLCVMGRKTSPAPWNPRRHGGDVFLESKLVGESSGQEVLSPGIYPHKEADIRFIEHARRLAEHMHLRHLNRFTTPGAPSCEACGLREPWCVCALSEDELRQKVVALYGELAEREANTQHQSLFRERAHETLGRIGDILSYLVMGLKVPEEDLIQAQNDARYYGVEPTSPYPEMFIVSYGDTCWILDDGTTGRPLMGAGPFIKYFDSVGEARGAIYDLLGKGVDFEDLFDIKSTREGL